MSSNSPGHCHHLTARFDVPLGLPAPREVRRAACALLMAWGYDREEWLGDAAVVISELVSNAVRHGGGCLEVDMTARGDSVVIGVADGSAVVPRRRAATLRDRDGRGLLLIEALAKGWGVQDRSGGGKRVWVQLTPYPPPPGCD